jgi:small subunit ribosomal protein S6
MNYYETLYIVHSALEAGRLKDIVLSVEELLKAKGGTPIATEVWGKKKLGYLIDKQKYGTYILVQFKSDGSKNNNFNVELEHNPSILAYMTIRIEEDGLREQTDDLDAQLAGKDSTNSNAEESNKEKTTETAETSTEAKETVEVEAETEVAEEVATETVVAEEPSEEAGEETSVASEEKVEE